MATTDITPIEASHWALAFRQAIEGGAARLAALWNAARNRRSVGRLLEWDDRMLRDIGLTHGDVHSALTARLQDDPSQRLSVISGERRRAFREQALERRRLTGW